MVFNIDAVFLEPVSPGTAKRFTVSGGVLVGADFNVSHICNFGFSTDTTEVVPEVEEAKVWTRVQERGQQAGLIQVGAEFLDSSEVTAEFVVRWHRDRQLGVRLVDDLGQAWTVSSTRAILDRRYLVYDVSRSVTIAETPD